MFCPRCRSEYREGLVTCPECDVGLLAELPAERQPAPRYVDLVTVLRGFDTPTMLVASSRLNDTGIPFFLKGEGVQDLFALGRMGLGFSPVAGPPEVQVSREDEARARAVLEALPAAVLSEAELAELAESAGKPEDEQPPIKGLGGLLSALGVVVFAFPVWIGYWLTDLVNGWNSQAWRDAVTPGSPGYHPLWAPFRVGWLVTVSLLLVWSCVLIHLFWHQKRWFPAAMSLFLAAKLAAGGLSLLVYWHILGASYLGDHFVVSAGLVLFWVPYLRLSERVRATFVE